MYSLPTEIAINNQTYKITNNGDYRMVIDCFFALNDIELSDEFRVYTCLIIFYEDINDIEDIYNKFGVDGLQTAIDEMFKFFNCNEAGSKAKYKLFDWKQDEQMICGAVNNVARTEIRALPYLHWWTFMGYYCAIGDSVFSTVLSIRDKIVKGKKLEKYEKEFKLNNPNYFEWNSKTVQQQEDDEFIMSIWNKE